MHLFNAHTQKHTGAIAEINGIFSDPSRSPTVGGVQCSGSETDLLSCPHSISIDGSRCDIYNDAGVVCQSGCGKLLISVYLCHVYLVRYS